MSASELSIAFSAASDGDIATLRASLDERPEIIHAHSGHDGHGRTLLMVAAFEDHASAVQLLCEAGCDINATSVGQYGEQATALWLACLQGSVDSLAVLLQAGAGLEIPNDGGETPLLIAALQGNTECIELLCAAGANIETVDNERKTPMLWACEHGNSKAVQILSSYGASRVLASEVALRYGHRDLATWLCESDAYTPLAHLEVLSLERARMLLRDGCDPHEGSPSALERSMGSTATARASLQTAANALATERELAAARLAALTHIPHFERRMVKCKEEARVYRQTAAEGRVAPEVSALVQLAARWSPESHSLFSARTRATAVELLRLGYLLAYDARFSGSAAALSDVWRVHILPQAITSR